MSLRSLGDVVARSPSCVTVPEDATVFSLSEALCAGRVDAAAILSASTNGLAGIATSRDVAKCIARGEDLDRITAAQIMTAHPVTLPPAETPANALALMRDGGFRHIPVVSEENGCILGIVDVLSLAYDAITRLQSSYSVMPTRRGFEFMRAARNTMEKPTLRPIIDGTPFATLTAERTVVEACETLARQHLAAVVVVDPQAVLDGIFTCSDVVKRVVVQRRNPLTTRLSQVMTENPDCAAADFTILESLQRMQACGFRHLPVVESHTRVVVGLCDVLQLASSAISRMGTMANPSPSPASSTDSIARARSGQPRGITSIFSSLFSYPYAPRDYEPESQDQLLNHVAPEPLPPGFHRPPPVLTVRRQHSFLRSDLSSSSRHRGGANDVALASFKFKDLNNEYRKIKVPIALDHGAYDQFVVDVRRRFAGSSSVGPIKIKYVDEDGDEVLISNDEDLASCFEDFVSSKSRTIQLKVYEVEKRSSGHLPSPVSSNASSLIGSPRQKTLASSVGKQDGPDPLKSADVSQLPSGSNVSKLPTTMPRTASKAVVLTPSMTKATEAQAKMLDENMDSAIALYNEAIKLDPDNARAQGGRGAAHLISGNSTSAEEDYRAAIALVESGKGGEVGDCTFQMCIVGLVEALIDQRRYEEAADVAGRIDPESGNTGCADAFRDELDSAGNAAREALEAGEFGDAMSCYSNALRVESAFLELVNDETGRASLRLGRAKCYKALEDFDMALEDYEAAVILEPESVAGHKGCGKCLAELEQLDRALESYERAHKLDPADDEVNKEIDIIRRILPDPMESKKAEIAKLGALLGGMKLPGKHS